jgi:predicted outer membrane repeat protein
MYMTNCTVAYNNSAANGGGVYCYAITAPGTVRIVNSTIYSNKATNANYGGGGIYTSADGTSCVWNCTVYGNEMIGAGKGGGLYNGSLDLY